MSASYYYRDDTNTIYKISNEIPEGVRTMMFLRDGNRTTVDFDHLHSDAAYAGFTSDEEAWKYLENHQD